MKVEQIYTGCLAQGAYFIVSEGEAAVIDPLRECSPYLERAKKEKVSIKYIFETHFHADFVSGHVDLSEKTGAAIVFGPGAETEFRCHVAKDGEEFHLGKIRIRALHTPGHTPESTTYLLIDEEGKEYCIFSGDTLFIGDVGRPDLAVKSDLTQEVLAEMLYDSLRNKIMPLSDEVIVYPAHGAGSACGKNLSKETFDTLGNQKKKNYALQNISKEDFVKELTTGILPPPQYFPKNALLNKKGYEPIDNVVLKGNKSLTAQEFENIARETLALILDVRKPIDFALAHLPNSIFIGLDGQFAPWVGALITDLHQPILLVTPEGREKETIMRLSRVGYDKTLGYLHGGIEAWMTSGRKTDQVKSITALEFENDFKTGKIEVTDVRKPGEFNTQHINGAQNKPLDFIHEWVGTLDQKELRYVHCAGGYRSMIACSILKLRGIHQVIDVQGGFSAIQKTNIPTTESTCSSAK